MCSGSFEGYSRVTINFETWGYQFMQKDESNRKRVRNLLEDCETSMVNGEKCLINYKEISKNGSKDSLTHFN